MTSSKHHPTPSDSKLITERNSLPGAPRIEPPMAGGDAIPPAHQFSPPTILSIAFPYAPIGPRAVGGAEVICSQLEAALPTLGFRSVVVAHHASAPAGTLYPTPVPDATITDPLRAEVEAAQQLAIDRALAENRVALVHMHGLDFHRYRLPEHLPVLVTLHLPPAWYPETIWSLPSNFHLLCVSETQRQACPESVRDRITVVPNGVPLPDPDSLRPEGKYALMLARICPEKNLHIGLDAARLANLPALLAGECFPYEAHLQYFADEIQPRLTAAANTHERRSAPPAQPTARFLGPVSGDEKTRLLTRAACLLLPSLAPETSSLVAMEALAAGVPVIAMAVGAIPEIVAHNHTGFLIPSETAHSPLAAQAMAEAIRNLPQLSRQACRSTAKAHFSLHHMLDGYRTLYRRLALTHPHRPNSKPETQRDPSTASPLTTSPLAPEQELHIEHRTTEADLQSLAPEWVALWAADPHATPFQHPAWLLPWWRHFGPDGQLHALTLRHPDTHHLLGLLPTYTYTPPGTDHPQLLLLGAGTSDFLDGLWHPRANPTHTAASALTHALKNLPFRAASLTQLRSQSPLLAAAQHLHLPTTPAEPTSLLDLATPLPPKILLNIGRYRRRAEAQGTLRLHLAETPTDAQTSFDHLVRLHNQRWRARDEAGVLADPRVLAHHREALPLLLAAGLLRLFRLTLNDTTLGVLYSLADTPHAADRRLFLYLIGFDPRFAPLSPGTLLLHAAWQHAQAHNFRKLDLLRGGEAYKQLWGAKPTPTFALIPNPPSP